MNIDEKRNLVIVVIFSIFALSVWIAALLLSRVDAFRTFEVVNFAHNIFTGALLAAFVFHLSHFFLDRTRMISLLFSILCLTLALLNKQFITIFIDISWSMEIRIEYTISFLATLSFVWYRGAILTSVDFGEANIDGEIDIRGTRLEGIPLEEIVEPGRSLELTS